MRYIPFFVFLAVAGVARCATVEPLPEATPSPTPYDHAASVCTPPPSVAGIEWSLCQSTGGDIRCCGYAVHDCLIILCRQGCDESWHTQEIDCSEMPDPGPSL